MAGKDPDLGFNFVGMGLSLDMSVDLCSSSGVSRGHSASK